MNYSDWKYPALKSECARRGIGGGGKRLELEMKLKDHDADQLISTRGPLVAKRPDPDEPQMMKTDTSPAQEPTWGEPEPELDPDPEKPTFANWDKDGRWIRRPKGFISWAFEEQKWEQEHG